MHCIAAAPAMETWIISSGYLALVALCIRSLHLMGSGNLMSVQVDSIFGHWSVCDLKSPATPDAQMSMWVVTDKHEKYGTHKCKVCQLLSTPFWANTRLLVFRTMQSFRITCFKIWTKMDPIYLGSIWSLPPTAPQLSVRFRLFQWPSQLLLHSWFASLVICGARFAIRNWLFVICGHMRVMRCALAMMIWLHTQWAVELNMSSSSPSWLQPENSPFDPSQLDFISFFSAIYVLISCQWRGVELFQTSWQLDIGKAKGGS